MGLKSIFGVWLLILPLMVLNGIIREVAFVPRVGRFPGDVASAVMGIVIILAVTRPFVRRMSNRSVQSLSRVSIIWVGLTVAFEFSFGHYVDGKTWGELVANYAIWQARLWPLVLLSLAAAPFVWASRVADVQRSEV